MPALNMPRALLPCLSELPSLATVHVFTLSIGMLGLFLFAKLVTTRVFHEPFPANMPRIGGVGTKAYAAALVLHLNMNVL